jgi:hypothetical protein
MLMAKLLFSIILILFIKRVKERYGEETARKVRVESKRVYQEILPHVPKVGGFRNYFAGIVIANGWFIATYKAMKSSGYTAADSMAIWAKMIDDLFRRMPGWLQARIGKFLTSDLAIRGFHKQAQRSQLRQFPGDWVYQINQDEGLDLAIEFDECAAIKMYRELGVEEMAPYCSFADVIYSTYLGIGIDATETLGLGFKYCKLYYSRNGNVKYNARLKEILPAILVENQHVQAVEKTPKIGGFKSERQGSF